MIDIGHEIGIVYTTVGSQEVAERLAGDAVQSGYAACVNIITSALSVYEWEGKIEKNNEYLMLFKTQVGLVQELCDWIADNHHYAVPAILTATAHTSTDFFDYIESVTGQFKVTEC